MEDKKWFILKGDNVAGPFSEEEINSSFKSDPQSYVWGKILKEWLNYSEWKNYLSDPSSHQVMKKNDYMWKYRFGGEEISGPYDYEEMLNHLRKYSDYEHLELSCDKDHIWKSIFVLPEIADKLGISRRKHPRVPIMGEIEAEFPDHHKETHRIISISQGGLGLSSAKKLKLGNKFKATITSANLNSKLHCECEVTYARDDGYVGVEFRSIPAESLNSIIEYIKKFEELS